LNHKGRTATGKKAPAKSFDAPWNKKLIGSPLLKTNMKLADIIPSEMNGISPTTKLITIYH